MPNDKLLVDIGANKNPPHSTNCSPLHRHLFHPRRSRKIISRHQQVALLRDLRRVPQSSANDMDRELALVFRLSAGPYRVEQLWPCRHAGPTQQSHVCGSKIGVLPSHFGVSRRSVVWHRDHELALRAEDFEGFVKDDSTLGKDRAITAASSLVIRGPASQKLVHES